MSWSKSFGSLKDVYLALLLYTPIILPIYSIIT